MLEAWLRHVVNMQQRAGENNLKAMFDGTDSVDDNLYIQRSANLKRFSTSKFHQLRLQHHNETLVQYVRSTETLKRQLKKRRLL